MARGFKGRLLLIGILLISLVAYKFWIGQYLLNKVKLERRRNVNGLVYNSSTHATAVQKMYSTTNEKDTANFPKLTTKLQFKNDSVHASRKKHNISPSKLLSAKFDKYVFLKVHKAGSSTVQNIFLRYGITRNLTFILSKIRPTEYNNVISTDSSLNDDNTQPPPPNKTFDISCCHVNYNRESFEKYIQGNVAYIGIVREPFSHFRSMIRYVLPSYVLMNLTSGDPVTRYLKNPIKYENGLEPQHSFTNNRMALEFGFPRHLFANYSKFESMKYLQKLDHEFVLVLLMEYLSESVVLMKRIFKWSLKDILYLKKNENMSKDYSRVRPKHEMLYKKYAKLDYDLYNHFKKRLLKRIKTEGLGFQREVTYFHKINAKVMQFCEKNRQLSEMYVVAKSPWSAAFNVTYEDCNYLRMWEHQLISMIRQRQYPGTDESLGL